MDRTILAKVWSSNHREFRGKTLATGSFTLKHGGGGGMNNGVLTKEDPYKI